MFKRNSCFLLILVLLEILFMDNVFAYKLYDKDYKLEHLNKKNDSDIKQVCAYTSDGFYALEENLHLLIIYDDNSAYYNHFPVASNGKRVVDDYVNNWSKNYKWDSYIDDINGLSKEAKSEYVSTGKCPDVLFDIACWAEWYFLGYNKNLPGANTWDTINEKLDKGYCVSEYYKLIKDDSYKEEDLTSCEYDDFTISYSSSDGIVRKIDIKKSEQNGRFNKYSISDSYKENYNILDEGKCPVILSCLDNKDYDTGTVTYNYSLYVDELIAEEHYEGCSQNVLKCIGGEYCDPEYNGLCPSYVELYTQLTQKNAHFCTK